VVLHVGAEQLSVDPNGRRAVALNSRWPDAQWWDPAHPALYQLRMTLSENGRIHERVYERFGFREVWVDGPDIMLNDHPVHMFSDWGHKATPYYYTDGWIRQWFGMMRDGNLNHSRLHTHPHPTRILDIADEEGILITGEAGLHGSGGAQAADSDAYWQAAADHVRRFVHRDVNRPCVLMWSVENEMRWNRDETDRYQRELPRLKTLFNELDPTRPAYHEGDTSLWNERDVDIVSRHYGKECAGIGWWDRERPLHSGEMSVYHYAGPNNTLHLGGDRVFAEYAAVDAAAALDTAYIVEAGRTLGVCNFGPWNLSCLCNLRMHREHIDLTYRDPTAPGVKPLRVAPHSSEFEFWKTDKGYTPQGGFEIQAKAFRPFAVIDLNLRSGYIAGNTFERALCIVNDTDSDVDGVLVTALCDDKGTMREWRDAVHVERGRHHTQSIATELDESHAGRLIWSVSFESGDSCLDSWERELDVAPAASKPPASLSDATIGIFGAAGAPVRNLLEAAGVRVVPVAELSTAEPGSPDILILAKNAVVPGSTQNVDVMRFVRAGGRVIVLEQTACLFPALSVEEKPVNTAFVRAPEHPVMTAFDDTDFAYWGNDPYALAGGDSAVARHMYRKDNGHLVMPLLDSGEGGFGHGDLELTPLFEATEGEGIILACQLRISDTLRTIPAARRLLGALLDRAASFAPAPEPHLLIAADHPSSTPADLVTEARTGATVLAEISDPDTLRQWGDALSLPLQWADRTDIFQAVRHHEHKLLSGISNQDTCGITTWTYSPPANRNCPVAAGAFLPCQGLEPILVTATKSCLYELFVKEGKTEPLRAHTLSRFLFDEAPPEHVLLGVAEAGRGRVILSAFRPDQPAHPGLPRARNLLLRNLGRRFDGSLLEGDAVPESGKSRGFPETCHVLADSDRTADWNKLVENTRYSSERMVSKPILTIGSWKRIECPHGNVQTPEDNRDLILYYVIRSAIARKNIDMDIDVPNPEALTFLDVQGTGTVSLVVNGCPYGTQSLTGGNATFSDIELEAGFNHVLLRWSPDRGDTPLTMRWRNIMRQPERAFQFV
jgi:hypothetical protein